MMVIIITGLVLSVVALTISILRSNFVGAMLALVAASAIFFAKSNLDKSKEEELKRLEVNRVARLADAKIQAEYDKLPKHLCIDGKVYIAHYYSLNPILAEPKGQVFEVVDNVSVPKKCGEQQ